MSELVIKPYTPPTEEELRDADKRTASANPSKEAGTKGAKERAVPLDPVFAFAKYDGSYVYKRFREDGEARAWAKHNGYIYDGQISEEFYERIKSYYDGRGD